MRGYSQGWSCGHRLARVALACAVAVAASSGAVAVAQEQGPERPASGFSLESLQRISYLRVLSAELGLEISMPRVDVVTSPLESSTSYQTEVGLPASKFRLRLHSSEWHARREQGSSLGATLLYRPEPNLGLGVDASVRTSASPSTLITSRRTTDTWLRAVAEATW